MIKYSLGSAKRYLHLVNVIAPTSVLRPLDISLYTVYLIM